MTLVLGGSVTRVFGGWGDLVTQILGAGTVTLVIGWPLVTRGMGESGDLTL